MKKLLSIFFALVLCVLLTNSSAQASKISISTFDELKNHLEYKAIKRTGYDPSPVNCFVLKPGVYELTKNISIDLDDSFFDGKKDAIKYGIISAIENFVLDGNGNTISFKQDNAVALFGIINTKKYTVENLKIKYPNNVYGFALAQALIAGDDDTDYAVANGNIRNVDVSVAGNVIPLYTNNVEQKSNYFIGDFKGKMATGFAWYIQNSNLEKIKINVAGNIGNTDRPTNDDDMVAAYGLTHHFGNVHYNKTINAKTWDELHNKGNASVLKDAAHIYDLVINVGGNIQAYGYNAGYSSSLGYDMSSAWIERADINITGDIITKLDGNSARMSDYSTPNAFGLSDELMNFTDSSLQVNNIIFEGNNLSGIRNLCFVGAMANNNSHGNYINISNNNIVVRGKIYGKSNKNILSSVGFNNDWDSNGGIDNNGKMISNGVDWQHVNTNNTYNVGSVILEGKDVVQYQTLGKKWRTGQHPIGDFKLPEASLQGSKVTIGDVNVKANAAYVSLLMYNSSNAKNNTLTYNNINVEANTANFYGMGHVQNSNPDKNYYKNNTENNHIVCKNITIKADEAPYVCLLAGYHESQQPISNCSLKADEVKININSANKTSYIGGFAGYSTESIDSCRLFLGSFNLAMAKGKGRAYMGLGAAYQNGASISNCGVFVDGDMNVEGPVLFGGGFTGYIKNSKLEHNDLQIDGKSNIDIKGGSFGGFVGYSNNSSINKNSSLYLNEFSPFIGFSKGGGAITANAHYVNGKAPMYFSGLIAAGEGTTKVSNNTLLVEREFDNTILYRKDAVSADSNNNYLVVVDIDNYHNRKAYATTETLSTVDEMDDEVPVFRKSDTEIGKINIAKRSFQEKYWNKTFSPYIITDKEQNFAYMSVNDAGNISVFGVDSNKIVKDGGKKAALFDYYHRHAGLVDDKGIVYDLLGIKGSLKEAPQNTPNISAKYPLTGDNRNITLYVILAILSVCMISLLKVRYNKN